MTTIKTNRMIEEFKRIRGFTESLVEPLEIEDFVVQADSFVSPTKWHLAHTTWFFETFILQHFKSNYKVFHENFHYLFNSYYESVGSFYPRHSRGLITRPTVSETFAYRSYVDEQILSLLEKSSSIELEELRRFIEIGLNHEQQHQELMLTDIKYHFSFNPTHPVYHPNPYRHDSSTQNLSFIELQGGLVSIGDDGDGFSFDNETPAHQKWLEPYRLANRPITNEEYGQFIDDGGYEKAELWLSDGWMAVKSNNWQAPRIGKNKVIIGLPIHYQACYLLTHMHLSAISVSMKQMLMQDGLESVSLLRRNGNMLFNRHRSKEILLSKVTTNQLEK